ncbi:MAG TPA: DMT family transporter [Verrucomicrobiae bacterium]|nr:DMT family transporter [Verrucomicrobiae bacterium]
MEVQLHHKTRQTAIAAVLLGATGIGVAPVLVRLSESGPVATAFFRIFLSLPLCWVWFLGSTGGKLERGAILPLVMGGLFFAGDLSVWHLSLHLTTVANSTLLTNFAPIFVFLGARFFLKERLSPGVLGSVLIALSGAALLVLESFQFSPGNLRGDLLALLTAVFYAGYLVSTKQARRTASTAGVLAVSGLVSCPILFVIAWLSGETFLPQHPRGWAVLFGLALVSHILGQGFIAFGLAHLPASVSSVTLLWQPVVAAALAAVVLGERLTTLKILGGMVVLAGIYLAQRSMNAPNTPECKQGFRLIPP